ncbi:hypothetical protein MSP8887_01930 [Marinomonas spartinae]|uniref:hypothetical protein n=1 Tax=Marinomonas spartinae TaxID=1792290 RepID=UPI0008090D10|nr:hypothetical protein [Marinomonas spartinae]SBS33361.1 hypothetical protein MSP8887_01930 [Marinomonas spartinae]
MQSRFICHQGGWVSLPIIVFLVVVAGVSFAYQQRLQTHLAWRGKRQEIDQNQRLWQAFSEQVVRHIALSSAQKSSCPGFCALANNDSVSHYRLWRYKRARLRYQFDQIALGANTHFYRLCAHKINTMHQTAYLIHLRYHCWWWHNHHIVSHGFVTVTK